MKHIVIAKIFLLVYSWALTFTARAQSTGNRNGEVDLLADLAPEGPVQNYAAYTFKSTRIINTHSIENVAAGVLDFRIMHRFGAINGGWYELWGLDQA
ncbi:MAG: DUF5777 family beta-barrel protein, partial [Bacteroidota bacterium]